MKVQCISEKAQSDWPKYTRPEKLNSITPWGNHKIKFSAMMDIVEQ